MTGEIKQIIKFLKGRGQGTQVPESISICASCALAAAAVLSAAAAAAAEKSRSIFMRNCSSDVQVRYEAPRSIILNISYTAIQQSVQIPKISCKQIGTSEPERRTLSRKLTVSCEPKSVARALFLAGTYIKKGVYFCSV